MVVSLLGKILYVAHTFKEHMTASSSWFAIVSVVHDLQDAVVKSFDISLDGMREVVQRLTTAFQRGLEDEESAVVKMFITYVHALPDKTEEGDFLALDLGGSNFRVLQLSQSLPLCM